MTETLVFDARDAQAQPGLSHWLALQRALSLSPAAALAALRARPDPVAALAALPHRTPPDAAPLREASARLARVGARLVAWGSPRYPWRLARLSDAPPVLAVRGDLDALSAPAVAVVGSRAATAYGRHVARELAGELAGAGLVIVSGLAHGIDAEAHRAALEAGGRTVAVQACGPDQVYPRAHRSLADRIARQGAVVSELPPGARPRRAYFPLRNRIVAGLALALLVVEARERSGSLTSASHAMDQGTDVFAVPGPITAPTSAGTNGLLAQGAWPALSARDLLETLLLPGRPAAPAARLPQTRAAHSLLVRLGRGPATRDELLRGQDAGRVASALLELELSGRVARDRDGRFRVVS